MFHGGSDAGLPFPVDAICCVTVRHFAELCDFQACNSWWSFSQRHRNVSRRRVSATRHAKFFAPTFPVTITVARTCDTKEESDLLYQFVTQGGFVVRCFALTDQPSHNINIRENQYTSQCRVRPIRKKFLPVTRPPWVGDMFVVVGIYRLTVKQQGWRNNERTKSTTQQSRPV